MERLKFWRSGEAITVIGQLLLIVGMITTSHFARTSVLGSIAGATAILAGCVVTSSARKRATYL
ncbi:hypothetical protein HNP46_000031 [Pseudomonas nitritireducens]|uniref:Uncharacterized protein n=1 Tax=Pseudomonas nitroreducens TaxID=46680 RepID=A0A7W7KE74_PSENT|nr:hypothetical protein [Pseudomonas nitritireducens]MBB4861220.1 hypothetical protein [Pseudomonas nitritireducens]